MDCDLKKGCLRSLHMFTLLQNSFLLQPLFRWRHSANQPNNLLSIRHGRHERQRLWLPCNSRSREEDGRAEVPRIFPILRQKGWASHRRSCKHEEFGHLLWVSSFNQKDYITKKKFHAQICDCISFFSAEQGSPFLIRHVSDGFEQVKGDNAAEAKTQNKGFRLMYILDCP